MALIQYKPKSLKAIYNYVRRELEDVFVDETGDIMTGLLTIKRDNLDDPCLACLTSSDTYARFSILASGKIAFGNGSSELDTTLERVGAGTLKISNNLQLAGDLSASGNITGASASISGSLSAGSISTGSLDVSSNASIGGDLSVNGNVDITLDLTVNDDALIKDVLAIGDTDVTLYRPQSSTLGIDAHVAVGGSLGAGNKIFTVLSSAGDRAFEIWIDGETYPRVKWTSDGKLYFGPGSADVDVVLYRGGADLLITEDSFLAPTLAIGYPTDSYPRIQMDDLSRILFGDGTNPPDIEFRRTGVRELSMYGALKFVRESSSDIAIQSMVNTDTNPRFQLQINGRMAWGDGSATFDCFLTRHDAGVLKFDNTTVRISHDSTSDKCIITDISGTDQLEILARGDLNWRDSTGASFIARLWPDEANWRMYLDGSLYVSGDFSVGGNKSALISDPENPERKIKFSSLEVLGDKQDFYVRGSVTVKGSAEVELPADFIKCVDISTAQAFLQPRDFCLTRYRIEGNKLIIETNEPDKEIVIDYMVIARRAV